MGPERKLPVRGIDDEVRRARDEHRIRMEADQGVEDGERPIRDAELGSRFADMSKYLPLVNRLAGWACVDVALRLNDRKR
jgi:hypothetical protein